MRRHSGPIRFFERLHLLNHLEAATLTIGATEAGVILGTAAYMSPEQARGKQVDKRAETLELRRGSFNAGIGGISVPPRYETTSPFLFPLPPIRR
jgi:hypothetical protein